MRETLAADPFGRSNAEVQIVGGNRVSIRTTALTDLSPEERTLLFEDLAEQAGITPDDISAQVVGPTWGAQISRQAIVGLVVVLAAITLYITLRFEWKMAIGAMVAMIHDVLITAGVYALTGREVSPATVIAILTILGFSLYDTVVIFDKVKENTESTALLAQGHVRGRRERLDEPGADAFGQHVARRRAADPVAAAVRWRHAQGLRVRDAHRRRSPVRTRRSSSRRRSSWCSRSGSPATSSSELASRVVRASAACVRWRPRRPTSFRTRRRARRLGRRGGRRRARRTGAVKSDASASEEQTEAAGQAQAEVNPMDIDQVKALVRDVPDFPQEGIVFKDITPLLADELAFSTVIDLIVVHFGRGNVDKVVGIEARGFILASPVAYHFGAGFVPVRKKDKLPWETEAAEYELEYGTATLEIHRDAIDAGGARARSSTTSSRRAGRRGRRRSSSSGSAARSSASRA